jgi:hypothetical protein
MYSMPPENQPATDHLELTMMLVQKFVDQSALLIKHDEEIAAHKDKLRQLDGGTAEPVPAANKNPACAVYSSRSLFDVPEALAFLGIPDTTAARAWMHDQFTPMPADEFWMIPRGEIEEFADSLITAIETARAQPKP